MAIIATYLNIERESSSVPSQVSSVALLATSLRNFPYISYPSQRTEEIETQRIKIDYRNLYISSDIRNWLSSAVCLPSDIMRGLSNTVSLPSNIMSLPMHDRTQTRLRLKREKELKELEQEAFLAIVSKFSQIEKVHSIYVQKYREELQIQILLSITQYDNDLMDGLLDIEYDIRKRYPEIVFEFFYPPAGISEKKDFIHPSAYCIYSK